MTQPVLQIPVSVYCNVCGYHMCALTRSDGDSFHVTPCPSCMKEERAAGYEAGYGEGFADGEASAIIATEEKS